METLIGLAIFGLIILVALQLGSILFGLILAVAFLPLTALSWLWEFIKNYKIEEEKRQEVLNVTFYATLFMVAFSIFILLTSTLMATPVALAEIIIFPILGFLVKKGSREASVILLIVFVIDRVVGLINWLDYFTLINFLWYVVISLIYWRIYYKAYIYLKISRIDKDRE